ncbi:MAG: alginate lyase family protein [Candidatus Malihini olakiniferum]
MNSNLDFAQSVPGIAPGLNAGVLDRRYFSTRIVDALIMLRDYKGWKKEDDEQMREWMTVYLNWLQTSKLRSVRRKRRTTKVVGMRRRWPVIAWYLDKKEVVSAMAALQRTNLNHQIQNDGAQSEELSRTRSFHYPLQLFQPASHYQYGDIDR